MSDDHWRIGREVTDDVLGPGAYGRIPGAIPTPE